MFITSILFILSFCIIYNIIILQKNNYNNDLVNINNKRVNLICSVLVVIIVILMYVNFDRNNYIYQYSINYNFNLQLFNISINLGIDGFSMIFYLLTSLIIFFCIIYTWRLQTFNIFAILLIFLDLILLILFAAKDILLLYLSFEIILIPMFILIGFGGGRDKKIRANYLFFFYTFIGSLFMIIGIVYIYYTYNTFNFDILKHIDFTTLEERWLWLSFFIGFSSKIPMFPFHIWLPEAHVEAPTVGSVVLAGILLKLGVYGFIRIHLSIFSNASIFFTPLIFTVCTLGVVYASFCACIQLDFKRLIAYSSVSHMNMVAMGIFAGNLQSFDGAILQCISHAFVSSGLFFLVGSMYDRYHSKLISSYSGLAGVMPIYAIMLLFFSISNIGMPGTSAFASEILLLTGIFNFSTFYGVCVSISLFFCTVYSLWSACRIMFGNLKISNATIYVDLHSHEIFVLSMLALFILIIGISPEYCLNYSHVATFQLNSLFI